MRELAGQVFDGLERLCISSASGDCIVSAPANDGIERIEARFRGDAYEPHRHDTYAIGVTISGVQTFSYRGEKHFSQPGQVIVLYPDELHDGAAGTQDGLVYRMIYIEPALLAQALAPPRGSGLPFVAEPVVTDRRFAGILLDALGNLDHALDDLARDDLIANAASLLSVHGRQQKKPLGTVAWRQADEARRYLEANALRGVASQELEEVTGLDRFALSRHFRAAFATSPHRFLLMRRLQRARVMIAAGMPLAETAAATGFADQSHLTRHFKKAYGVSPGAWAGMIDGASGQRHRVVP